MAYVLNKFFYTKLFWYDGEQGNNRCLCLSHILTLFMDGWGISTPLITTDIMETCSKNTERHHWH